MSLVIDCHAINCQARDNGPEYFSGKLPFSDALHRLPGKLLELAETRGISIRHIQPTKPRQNACIERYKRTVRHEWLDQHIIEEAQDYATQWLWTYNHDRPNMVIGAMTPAQKLNASA